MTNTTENGQIRIRICEMPDLTVVSRVRLDLIHSHFRGSVLKIKTSPGFGGKYKSVIRVFLERMVGTSTASVMVERPCTGELTRALYCVPCRVFALQHLNQFVICSVQCRVCSLQCIL